MTRRTLVLALSLLVLSSALVPAGVAAADTAPLPGSMAAVGDSITQAASSGGVLGGDAPENSWSTGTSSTVSSHYLRLVAAGAPISGKAYNRSISGAKVADLNGQMQTVVGLQPDYLTVLIGGNDLCTDTAAQMTSVADFRTRFATAMTTLTQGSPSTYVYVVSIPDAYQLWNLFRNDWWARFIWSTFGICQSLLANPTSTQAADVQRRAEVRQRNIDYNTQLAEVCALHERCRFDGNAVFNTSFTTSDVSGDYFHPSVAGQRKLAAVTWAAGYSWQVAPPPNQPPVAGFSTACGELTCSFTDTSNDADGSIVARSWSFGDGSTSTAANPSHTYGAAGTYLVTLTVTDDDGASASASSSVSVAETPAPTMWVESLTSQTSSTKRGWTATVGVLVVDADGRPVPGASVSAAWSVGTPDTCLTGVDGRCAVTSDTLNARKVASVTMTVTGLTHATLGWDETQGISSITVARPG